MRAWINDSQRSVYEEDDYGYSDERRGSQRNTAFGERPRERPRDESCKSQRPSYRQKVDEEWGERTFGSFRGYQDYPREFYDDDEYEESFEDENDYLERKNEREDHYRRNVGRSGSGLKNIDD